MTSTITKAAASRIAKAHNECGGNLGGGYLAFNADGHGGEWYSAGSRPSAAIIFPVRAKRVTANDVLDWFEGETYQRDLQDELDRPHYSDALSD
jgi:hypothetical protein